MKIEAGAPLSSNCVAVAAPVSPVVSSADATPLTEVDTVPLVTTSCCAMPPLADVVVSGDSSASSSGDEAEEMISGDEQNQNDLDAFLIDALAMIDGIKCDPIVGVEF